MVSTEFLEGQHFVEITFISMHIYVKWSVMCTISITVSSEFIWGEVAVQY